MKAHVLLCGCVMTAAALAATPGVTLEPPRPLLRAEDLGRPSRNNYGSLEPAIETMRAHRPLDFSAGPWRNAHRSGTHAEWAKQARQILADGLHYDAGKLALDAKTLDRWETDSFVRETIEFNTSPWFRVPGYFYVPKNVPLPAPALVVFHEWGGKPHCYDAEIQEEALAWFDTHLKKR